MAGARRDLRHHDGSRVIGVMAHAERQRFHALTRGKGCGLTVEDDLAPARRMPPHLNRAPVAQGRLRPQRLQRRFLGREPHGESLGRGMSNARPAVRRPRAA